jgi:hypothetical protein
VIEPNLDDVTAAAFAIEGETRREQAKRIPAKLPESRAMIYDGSPRTARLHAMGPTVHSLPWDLRHLAHRGATVLDLKASQLAIVAVLWGCAPLLAFMEAGSPWEQWLMYLGVGPERKPTLKRGLYSLAYGRSEYMLHRYLFQTARMVCELLAIARKYEAHVAEGVASVRGALDGTLYGDADQEGWGQPEHRQQG